jgi:type VI secretion system protein ImpG
MLSILYPHYMRPIPSMSVVEFYVDPAHVKPESGLKLERGAILRSRPLNGVPCKFRTCYDVTFWPLTVAEAEWTTPDRLKPPMRYPEAVAAVRLQLRCAEDITFPKLSVSSLRFYLSGESALVHSLYELLSNNCIQIIVRDGAPKSKVPPVVLPPDSLRAVGFEDDEGILPFPRRSFVGYGLVQEYFCFPEKFFFFDLNNLDRVIAAGFGDSAEVIFMIAPFERNDRRQTLELGVNAKTFRLGCSPVVNLFPQTAEPILVSHRKYEYPVVPDISRRTAMEVFEISEVVSTNTQASEVIKYEPFYSFRHGQNRAKIRSFWHATRRQSTQRDDDGTEMFLSLVDLSGHPVEADVDALTVRCICTNRDLPSRLPFGNEAGDFELESAIPIKRAVALLKPTDTLRPPVGQDSLWRLVSQLSLNYLSLVSEGRDAFQELLRLYNFSGSTYSEKHIDGIVGLDSSRHFARVESKDGVTFCRGTQVRMEFDEEQFTGAGVYLFAAVIEQFLGMYVSMNSFSQLIVRTNQRKEVVRQWQPRAGRKILM